MTSPCPSLHRQPTGRIEALGDGVFAIAMTILVFDLKVPEVRRVGHLADALAEMWVTFLAYAISFALLGLYWSGHRTQFHYIRHADAGLHWLNILFLACVSLVPFSTKLLDAYPEAPAALTFYGVNLIGIGLALYAHWKWATWRRRLIGDEVPEAIICYGTIRCLAAPICYAAAIGLAFVDPRPSLVLYALVPALYITPGVQRWWLRLAWRWGAARPRTPEVRDTVRPAG